MPTKLNDYLNYGATYKFANRNKRKGARDAASARAAEQAKVQRIEQAMQPYTATPPAPPMAAQMEGRTVADLVRARKAMGLPAVPVQQRYAPGQSPQEVVARVKAQWGAAGQDVPERFRPVDPVRQRVSERMSAPQEIPERFRARPQAAPAAAPSQPPPPAIVHVPQSSPAVPPASPPGPQVRAAAGAASRIPAWMRTRAGMAALGIPVAAGLGYGAYRLSGGDGEKRSSQLSEGTRVEKKEHGKDFDALAKQVAKAHLKEDPRYYTHLKAMEEGKNPFVRDHAK